MLEYLDDYETPAKIYTFVSGACVIVDVISLFIYLVLLGKFNDVFYNLVQLFFVTTYLYIDCVYYLYLIYTRFKMPTNVRD